MTSIVVAEPNEDAAAHIRTDGTPWPFALSRPDTTVFADNPSELLSHLIPGYPLSPDQPDADEFVVEPVSVLDRALILRWQTAVATASEVQALICADRVAEGVFDPSDESEEALTALFGDKTIAFETLETWDNEHVPLVLIATDYDPFTERAPVTGNILWIDPSDEIAFLNSLSNLGVIDFYVHDGE